MNIVFLSNESFCHRYQELLRQEWSAETLGSVIAFLREQITAAGFGFTVEGDGDEEPGYYPVPPSASEELREHLEGLNYTLRIEHEKKKKQRQSSGRNAKSHATL